MKLNTKLISSYLAVGIVPLLIAAGILYYLANNAIQTGTYEKMSQGETLKKKQLEGFFKEREGDINVLKETVVSLKKEAFSKLNSIKELKKNAVEQIFQQMNIDIIAQQDRSICTKGIPQFQDFFKTNTKSKEYIRYSSIIDGFVKATDYYDYFIFDNTGHCVYSSGKEADYNTNFVSGKYKDSNLGHAVQKSLKGSISFADFAPYAPSNGEPASFIAAPIIQSGKQVGVVALQIGIDKIQTIMANRTGLGKTGETYLVGSDYLMRSNSFLDPTNRSIKASFANPANGSVRTRATEDVFVHGKSDTRVVKDYNGNFVLSSYTPIKVHDITWAMIAEIDLDEATSPLLQGGNYKNKEDYFFHKYVKLYGYYDLFLINKDGYCYYSAFRENDYQTNLVSGKYKDSNLGELVREVMQTKKYGIADFAPYAPSNGTQAAFIALPILSDNGEVETIVALQLSSDAINSVVQNRTGLGKTGESYLVGKAKDGKTYMRSDRVVKTGNNIGKEKSGKHIDLGLSGKSGKDIKTGSSGKKELISYAPLDIKGLDWTIQTSIAYDEAFAAVNKMTNWALGIAVIAIAIILGLAIYIAQSIYKPINTAVTSLDSGSDQVKSASSEVSSSGQALASGASEQAASLEEISASLEEMTAMTQQNTANASQANTMSTDAANAANHGITAMETMTSTINEIKSSSNQTAKIIKTIDEIAFQTNLLALNAAVEAARAGEAGKGFAVVAEEVRNLAQRSAQAAKDTSALIEESQKNADSGVNAADEVNKIIATISDSVTKVSQLIGEVSVASKEQSEGINQVNEAVAQLDQLTQSNAANAEEAAASGEELDAQANELKSVVGSLSAIVEGNQAGLVASNRQMGYAGNNFDSAPRKKIEKKKTAHIANNKQLAHSGQTPDEVIPMDDDDFSEF